uniref:Uncharacterized protein n=1 Tax=Oryza glumipatula TaxID=40148 RepID=A0A0E0AZJ1_9ORYZ
MTARTVAPRRRRCRAAAARSNVNLHRIQLCVLVKQNIE